MYSYLTGDKCVDKKVKVTKKYVIKREITFQDYNEDLKDNKTIPKSQQRFRSEVNNVFTEKVIKNVLSVNEDKRIQTPIGVIS